MTRPRTGNLRSFINPSNLLLIALGCASLAIYYLSTRAPHPSGIVSFLKLIAIQCLVYAVVVVLAFKSRPSRSTVGIIILFAALFRLSVLFAPPYLSDDIYRYVWDGRVQAAGINPYRYIPADPALAALRDEKIYPYINRRDYAHTIYPPVAEGIFFLTTRISESVTWMKATLVIFEGVAVWAIAQLLVSFGLPRQRLLIYAWHPLTVWEFAGSGHVDAIAIAFIALALLARRRESEVGVGLALAAATLAKFFPIVLFPVLFKRAGWKMPLALAIGVVVGYLPYLGVGPRGALGFLFGFAAERGLESGEHFFLLRAIRTLPFGFQIPTIAFVIVALLIGAALVLWTRTKDRGEEAYLRQAVVIAAAFTVLLSPHFPWYFVWLIPFLCFVPSVPVFYLTLASFFMYLTWLYWQADQVLKIKALIYVPFFLLLAISLWARRQRVGGGIQSANDSRSAKAHA